ncbi:unnamed protein product, partial [Timema podura]|nr:unnamed protein product [Timema podura]
MKHISEAMDRLQQSRSPRDSNSDVSILEKVLLKTNNPKIAAVMAMDLFLVGVDTTSVAITSTLYQLAKNPSKQQRLFRELNQVLPSADTPLEPASLDKLTYLKACIKETLRYIHGSLHIVTN